MRQQRMSDSPLSLWRGRGDLDQRLRFTQVGAGRRQLTVRPTANLGDKNKGPALAGPSLVEALTPLGGGGVGDAFVLRGGTEVRSKS